MGNIEDNIFENNNLEEDQMMEDSFELSSLVGEPIHLVLDDDTEMDTIIIASFYVDGYEDMYIALLPLTEDGMDEEDSEVFLYRIAIDQDGAPLLGCIESDEEYEAVSQVFYDEMDRLEDEM